MTDLFSSLTAIAEATPSAIASVSRYGHLPYPAFCQNIDAVARHAVSLGIRPGQLILVSTAHADARMQVILGLMRIGCRVAVTQAFDAFPAAGLRVDAMISDEAKPPPGFKILPLNPNWFRAGPKASTPPATDSGTLIFGSSGTTGRTKPIEVSAKGFLQRVAVKLTRPYHQDGARYLVTYGESTDAALQESLAVLQRGGTIFRPLDRSPASILDAIAIYQPTYTAMSPAMLVDLLRILKEKPARLRKIDFVNVTGAACSAATKRQAEEILADRVTTAFGATEIGTIASGYYAAADNPDLFVGRLDPGVEVLTIGEAGQPLPQGETGQLRIKVPDERLGAYIGSSDGVGALQDGWFVPGDIGRVDADRNFYIAGRASQVINFGGTKLHPEDFENAVTSHANIRELAVAGIEGPDGFQRIHAALVSRDPMEIEHLNRYLQQRDARLVVHVLKRVERIPRTESGKVDRVALRQLLVAKLR